MRSLVAFYLLTGLRCWRSAGSRPVRAPTRLDPLSDAVFVLLGRSIFTTTSFTARCSARVAASQACEGGCALSARC